MRYRRAGATDGTYSFMPNLAEPYSELSVPHIAGLRTVMQSVMQVHPFATLAMVVLPEHLYTMWRLPLGDAGYPLHGHRSKPDSRCD